MRTLFSPQRWLADLCLGTLLCLLMLPACRPNAPANPRLEIHKAAREMILWDGSRRVRVYRVGLGFNPAAPKQLEGDGATPVGEFFVCMKNPESKFHRSLGISYPGPQDAERGRAAGWITDAEYNEILAADRERRTPPWKTKLGGEICIHGGGAESDWTLGCIAVTDGEIDELFEWIPRGSRVTIYP